MLMPSGVIKLIDFGCAKRLCIVSTNLAAGSVVAIILGISKDVALLSLIVIVLQSSSFVFVCLCIV